MAFDLLNVTIVNPNDKEELALTLNTRKSKFNRAGLEEFGKFSGMNTRRISGVFDRFLKNKKKAEELIEMAFLSDEYKEKYRKILSERYNRLYS